MYGSLFLLAPAIVKLDPDSTVCFLSCFSPSHALTILLPVCALFLCLLEPSVLPKAPIRALNSHHLALACYSLLVSLLKDTYCLPPSPFLSHISLLVKCHLKMPALSTIKSHANTRVPVKSHPNSAPHWRSRDASCLWLRIYSLSSFPFCFGTPHMEILVTMILCPSQLLPLTTLCLQSCNFLKPIQVNMTLCPGLSAPGRVLLLLLLSAPSSPAPLRLASSISSSNPLRPLGWASL